MSRREREHITGRKAPRCPRRPSEIDISVRIQKVKRRAQLLQARAIGATAARLGQYGLALIIAEVCSERTERGVDVVGYAVGALARAVAVEIFVDVVDEARDAAVRVRDGAEGRARSGREGAGGRIVGSGKKDHLG